MTYLDRPILLHPIDWATQPNAEFRLDLRELQIGFGKLEFGQLQDHVVHGFQFDLWLQDEQEISNLDAFFNELHGRLAGFWLPGPKTAFRIVALVGGTLEIAEFDIVDQRLRDSWQQHPARHVWFTKAGQDPVAAVITAVVLDGNVERITVEPNIAAVDDTWTARWLHYVRQVDDEEMATIDAESRQTRTIRVVELPTEYAEQELGIQPVYLYRFWSNFGGTEIDWHLTSYHVDYEDEVQLWNKAAIDHGSLSRTVKADQETVTIDAVYEPDHPLALFVPFTLPVRMFVQIRETVIGSGLQKVLFTGRVLKVEPRGRRLTARCRSILDDLGGNVPRMMIQARCNYQTFDGHTCKLVRGDWEVNAAIDSITGQVIRVIGAGLTGLVDDWFSGGWIETGADGTFEIRTILKSEAIDTEEQELTLNAPLIHAIATQAVVLLPGDDLRAATCHTKFDNFENFGGHPFVPRQNLTLEAIKSSPSGGGKK